MKLEDLLLTREEIVISETERLCYFTVPIHPSLITDLPEEIQQDPDYLLKVIPETMNWFKEDLETYYERLKNEGKDERAEWIKNSFLNYLGSETHSINDIPGWIPNRISHNGFPYTIGITGDTLLYIVGGYLETAKIDSRNHRFTKEKFFEYKKEDYFYEQDGYYACNCYSWLPHNTDYMPQALILRNWAILYHNELLKELHKL